MDPDSERIREQYRTLEGLFGDSRRYEWSKLIVVFNTFFDMFGGAWRLTERQEHAFLQVASTFRETPFGNPYSPLSFDSRRAVVGDWEQYTEAGIRSAIILYLNMYPLMPGGELGVHVMRAAMAEMPKRPLHPEDMGGGHG